MFFKTFHRYLGDDVFPDFLRYGLRLRSQRFRSYQIPVVSLFKGRAFETNKALSKLLQTAMYQQILILQCIVAIQQMPDSFAMYERLSVVQNVAVHKSAW
ncbi:hypothetical protein BOW51_06600 [Solemya velesiana gill symbiont]|uniref:Uncharacterized protein n=1 Tax=Solemya velesiana gill symbiont TaxID=1918948 RepID=A0A1T2KUR3_9GAMM|nr:hypothetical protein BOW51_06600 [Solemya velesiana gill symbiont]